MIIVKDGKDKIGFSRKSLEINYLLDKFINSNSLILFIRIKNLNGNDSLLLRVLLNSLGFTLRRLKYSIVLILFDYLLLIFIINLIEFNIFIEKKFLKFPFFYNSYKFFFFKNIILIFINNFYYFFFFFFFFYKKKNINFFFFFN